MKMPITEIIIPTRLQPDTLIAIFLLQRYGKDIFPGIDQASIVTLAVMPEGVSDEGMRRQGKLLLDLGKGDFDHHGKEPKTTTSALVARHLAIHDDPSLKLLLAYAERDDFFGKGTLSQDPIDRAFGLSALIANLNRVHHGHPEQIAPIVMALLEAHVREQDRRYKELPQEVEQARAAGDVREVQVKQGGTQLRVIMITSDNVSLAGYLRSQLGGRYDVVVQWTTTKHVNLLTRPTKRPDLSELVGLIRAEEAMRADRDLELDYDDLVAHGRHPAAPEWYYDPATNSLFNGGVRTQDVEPTRISPDDLWSYVSIGLSGGMWQHLSKTGEEPSA